MTLTSSNDVPPAPTQADKPQYLIFFSSGSPPWCPDCVDAQPAIQKVFGGSDADAHLVLVDRPLWKAPDNKFRKEYGIRCIPTIVKFVDGKEVTRLEDTDSKNADTVAALVKN